MTNHDTAIGGYFGLELAKTSVGFKFLNMSALNSGRNALEFILRNLYPKPECVYLPYYTCEVVLEPLKHLGIKFQFYNINELLEIKELPLLRDNEYIIANNYFGIKDNYIDNLPVDLADKMIVDDAQAFYHNNHLMKRNFYSPRKFVGVADGGYAHTSDGNDADLEQDYSTERSIHLLSRIDKGAEAGFQQFKMDDASLNDAPLRKMSNLTKRILESIDYKEVKNIRKSNFEILHDELASKNKLQIPGLDSFACPMVYPFLSENGEDLKKKLISNKIFVATYWPNVFEWCTKNSLEYDLAKNLVPLPIDQRYGSDEMNRIIKIVKY